MSLMGIGRPIYNFHVTFYAPHREMECWGCRCPHFQRVARLPVKGVLRRIRRAYAERAGEIW